MSSGCTCARDQRRWLDSGSCEVCGRHVLEEQLAPVLLQILCGGTGLALWRNTIGYDDGYRKNGTQKHIQYGVGGDGAGDYIGCYRGYRKNGTQKHIQYGVGGDGAGDYIGCYRGRYVEVETKRQTGTHADNQRARQQLVGNLGGIYAVVRNETQARALLAYLRSLP